LLKQNKEKILDIGCGRGHSSFVISTYIKPKELVCADMNFRNLYLAKKYIAKDANFVCLDANYPLPFKNEVFSTTMMLDAFHYVQARALLAAEMERTLLPEGFLLLLHMHNSLVYNVRVGEPLPSRAWINLFRHFDVRALPERRLIEDFILRNKLDLAKEYSKNELNASNAICIVGTKDKSVLKTFDNVWGDFLKNKNNLMINPLYVVRYEGNQIVLQRKFPKGLFDKEYPLSIKYLPQRCVLDAELFKSMKGRALNIIPEELSAESLKYIENLRGCPTITRQSIDNIPRAHIKTNSSSQHIDTL
jgi:SAM-dependent methyltransferase